MTRKSKNGKGCLVCAETKRIMGVTGMQGNNGAMGSSGKQGEQGPPGSIGSQGKQGQPGSIGESGDMGTQGATGTPGRGSFQTSFMNSNPNIPITYGVLNTIINLTVTLLTTSDIFITGNVPIQNIVPFLQFQSNSPIPIMIICQGVLNNYSFELSVPLTNLVEFRNLPIVCTEKAVPAGTYNYQIQLYVENSLWFSDEVLLNVNGGPLSLTLQVISTV